MALKRYILDKRIFVEKTNKTVVKIQNQLDLYQYIIDVASAGVASIVTASNGLTATNGDITLGGTLSTTTTINSGSSNFTVTGKGIVELTSTSGLAAATFGADISTSIGMTYDDGVATASIGVLADGGNSAPGILMDGLPVCANEAAAIVAGLLSNTVYSTATGELRIKL